MRSLHPLRSSTLGSLAMILAVTVGPSPARADAPAATGAELRVDGGAAASPMHASADELRKQFAADVQTVTYQSHGKPHTATAIPLLAVLQAAGIPTGMQPPATGSSVRDKHRPMRIVIEASADDGYAVIFSLGELLPDVGHQAVWLAFEEDGQALPANRQPVDLIVPGDTKPARWVHGVTHVIASDYTPATTQP